MKEFELSKYTVEAEELLSATKKAFLELDLSTDELPNSMKPDDGAIKLVFVGQYSAGKSSIIKMLSGIDTGIGAAITTQKSHTYNWNDLQIIDTPGIQTGLRPDHDEITYNEIDHASLLVFVVTSEGFDRQMGEHFQKLAIEQKRGNNMVLVINKMDRAMAGNSLKQQEIILNDIKKVISPYEPKDLYVTFISTQLYEESLKESDTELKRELLEESGHDTFIDNLNSFVSKRQISSKLQQPLYTLEKILQKAMEQDIDEESISGAEELIKRQKNIFVNTKNDILKDLKYIVQSARNNIYIEGRNASLCIRVEKNITEEQIKQELESSANKAENIVNNCEQEINVYIQNKLQELDMDLEELMTSSFAQNIAIKLQEMPKSESIDDNSEAINIAKKISNTLLKEGLKNSNIINNMSDGELMAGIDIYKSNLANFSGSYMHTAIKEVGSFVGIKFAPWEALKWAKGLATVASVVAVLGTLYQLWEMFTKSEKEAEVEEKIRSAREDIVEAFNKQADNFYEQAISSIENNISKLLDPKIVELKNELQAFQERRDLLAKRQLKLNDILVKEQSLMRKIKSNII